MILSDPYEIVVLLLAGFFYILSAGAYAFFYSYGKMKGNRNLQTMSFLFTGLMLYCAYEMITSPVFSPFWKGLLSFATLSYMLIPQGMWWVVVRVHRTEEEERQRA